MQTFREAMAAYQQDPSKEEEMYRALAREIYYVPFREERSGAEFRRTPAVIEAEDGTRYYAAFSSVTDVDVEFYKEMKWRKMAYPILEQMLLRQEEQLDVYIDPFSESSLIIRAQAMRRIAENRKPQEPLTLKENGVLDTEVDQYRDEIDQIQYVFAKEQDIARVFPLLYTDDETEALCFVLDVPKSKDRQALYQRVVSGISAEIGNRVSSFLVDYAEMRKDIKKLKAMPCYTREA